MSLIENNPSTLLALALGVITVVFYLIFWTESKALKFWKSFPGPKLYLGTILGNSWQLRDPARAIKVVEEWERTYGRRFRVSFGGSIRGLVLTDPEDVGVLSSPVWITKGPSYNVLLPWLGTGLIPSNGEKWHSRRKLLMPAFQFNILSRFQHVFNAQSRVLVDILKEKQMKNEACEIHQLFTRCALDIICETAMGKKLNTQSNLDHHFAVATIKETAFVWFRWMRFWLHPNIIWNLSPVGRRERANRKILHDFTDQVIRERKQELLANAKCSEKNVPEGDDFGLSSKEKFAFLDMLINIQAEGKIELTDRDIREETDNFMFGGHDTTSAALSWSLYLIARNPEHQAAVHQELDAIFGSDKMRAVVVEDLTKLKSLECCIKEGLRLYPSVSFFMRKALSDFKLGKVFAHCANKDDNTTIPAGACVWIAPWLTHRNPEIYPEPEKYLPSRFLQENSLGRHAYAYIPFSAGPRNCIGQKYALAEMKTILAIVLRHFTVDLASQAEVIPVTQIITRPHQGIELKFVPR